MAFGTDFTRTFHEFKLLAPMIPHICIATNPFIYNFMSITFHTQFKAAFMCKSSSTQNVVALDETGENICETLEVPLQEIRNTSSAETNTIHLRIGGETPIRPGSITPMLVINENGDSQA